MSTLRPRTPCTIVRFSQRYDGFGRAIPSTHRRRTKCAIIWLRDVIDTTSVRTDTSASEGRALEELFDARLLFHPRDDDLQTEDIVEVTLPGRQTYKIKIGRTHRRIDVNGRLHHIEVHGMRWEDGT